MRGLQVAALLAATVLGCAHLNAQENRSTGASEKPEKFYKLVFRVIETGGDSTAPRGQTYTQVLSDGPNRNEIRTGDKVPIATGSSASNAGGALVSTQFQYIDVGTEIDTHGLKEIDASIQAHVTVKLSSVGKPTGQGTVPNEPVIRQCQWDAVITVPTGKPTIIFSSDNPSDKGKTELELTATPIR